MFWIYSRWAFPLPLCSTRLPNSTFTSSLARFALAFASLISVSSHRGSRNINNSSLSPNNINLTSATSKSSTQYCNDKHLQCQAAKANHPAESRQEARSASTAVRSSRVTLARLVFRLVLRKHDLCVCGVCRWCFGGFLKSWSILQSDKFHPTKSRQSR